MAGWAKRIKFNMREAINWFLLQQRSGRGSYFQPGRTLRTPLPILSGGPSPSRVSLPVKDTTLLVSSFFCVKGLLSQPPGLPEFWSRSPQLSKRAILWVTPLLCTWELLPLRAGGFAELRPLPTSLVSCRGP